MLLWLKAETLMCIHQMKHLIDKVTHFFFYSAWRWVMILYQPWLPAGDEQYGAPLNSSVWESWVSWVAEWSRKAPLLLAFEAIIIMTQTPKKEPTSVTAKWLTGSS